MIEGDVRGFRERTEQRAFRGRPRIIWTFRVERYDDRGNRLLSVPVTMQSRRMSGYLADGNRVRVRARRRRTGDVRASKVENLTTGSVVVASPFSGALVPLLILVALVGIVYGGSRLVGALGDGVEALPTVPSATRAGPGGGQPVGGGVPTPQTMEPTQSPSVETPSPSPEPEPEPEPPALIACSVFACLTSDGNKAEDVSVPAGAMVEWRNDSTEMMALVLPDGFEGPTSDLAPGESFVLTFEQAGTVEWKVGFSSGAIHPGRVTVTEGG